jgi:hypothetical protein
MLTQVTAGLLASGHYTHEVDLDDESDDTGLTKLMDHRGHFYPLATSTAEVLIRRTFTLILKLFLEGAGSYSIRLALLRNRASCALARAEMLRTPRLQLFLAVQ